MSHLTIGSGDIRHLLSGLQTKGYADLWRKFLDEHPPHYNAYASPIDALRTGAILEDLYAAYLPDNYFVQIKYTCKELDVLRSSVDFSEIREGKTVDFEELKTIFLPDFINIIRPASNLTEAKQIDFIKKKFKTNYQQIQCQLLCTELDSAKLTFLSVETYDDYENSMRIIEDNDVIKFRIPRDEELIQNIRDRAKIFQRVKDHFKQ